ncbi:MAG: alpha/beta fold hydrolase [Pseudolysinimonas sp.]
MTTVVFIQGGGAGARDEDEPLVASLRRELGDGIQVDYPVMPNEDEPDEETWGAAIATAIESADVVVGHSIGAYLLVRQLATSMPARIRSLHLIAAPYPGGDADWTFDGFELPDDFGARLTAPVFLYASEDDQIVPFAHRDLYAAAIPGAQVRTTTGGHQLGDDLSVVAADITPR